MENIKYLAKILMTLKRWVYCTSNKMRG